MAINDWPKAERPREKLLAQGAHSLSDAELLAIFLRTGCKGMSAVDLARKLLQHFGNLRAILDASPKDFCRAHGLGIAKYVQLQATLEIAGRHLAEKLTRTSVFTNPDNVRQYLITKLRDRPQEIFTALFLDSRHQLLAYKELFYGTHNAASVYPREVVKAALEYNAAALVVAHNHPSGISEPSQADCHITHVLRDALALVDIRLLDHFIIGDGRLYSFAEHGTI